MTARAMPPLPRLTSPDEISVMVWANELVAALERQFQVLNTPAATGWTISNVTASRTLNGGTATLSQTTEALGTLISDLQIGGVITK